MRHFSLFCIFLLFPVLAASSIQFELSQCISGDGSPPQNGVLLRMSEDEFFEAYESVFHMSDGSSMEMASLSRDGGSTGFFQESLRYTSTLMR